MVNTPANAMATVGAWAAGAFAFALLRLAVTSGVLESARTPKSLEAIGADLKIDAPQADALCRALTALGILDRAGQHHTLSPAFATPCSPEAPAALPNLVRGQSVMLQAISQVGTSYGRYTKLSPEDLL